MKNKILKRVVSAIMVYTMLFTSTDMSGTMYASASVTDTKESEVVQIPEESILDEKEIQKNTGLIKAELIKTELPQPDTDDNIKDDYQYSMVYESEWDKYSTHYIYNLLDDDWKETWDQLYNTCMSYLLTDGDVNTINADVPEGTTNEDEVYTFIEKFKSSHPQFYFLKNQYGYSTSGGEIVSVGLYIYEAFKDGEARTEATANFKSKIDLALSSIRATEEDDIIEQIHAYVIENVEYNHAAIEQGIMAVEENQFTQSAYSALCMNLTVCAGYGRMTQILCNAMGIDALYVTSAGHAWNKVCIDDSWYNVDTTWGDQSDIYYKWYGRSDAIYELDGENHRMEAHWTGYVPPCTLETIPTDNSMNYDWYTRTFPIISNTVAAPVIFVTNAGEKIRITINTDTGNAKIYYTLNTTTPDSAATKAYLYTEPITVEEGTVVKAVGVLDTYYDSDIVTSVASTSTITVEPIEDRTYAGGAEIKPQIRVFRQDGIRLVEGTDYRVSYSDNINAGTATVEIEFIGLYAGTSKLTREFEILPKKLSEDNIAEIPAEKYNGEAYEPALMITDGEKKLTLNKDYTVAYRSTVAAGGKYDMINAGRKFADVTFIGNYSGSARVFYEIAPISDLNAPGKLLIGDIEDLVYTGMPIVPEIEIAYDDVLLINGIDYDVVVPVGVDNTNVNPTGSPITLTILFTGNYSGVANVNFNIVPRTLNETNIQVIPDEDYTGSEVKPNPIITYSASVLIKDRDYILEYLDADYINVGEKHVKVTFIGNFTGEETVHYFVVPIADVNEAGKVTIGELESREYTGEIMALPEVEVRYEGTLLVKDRDYELSFAPDTDPVNVGRAELVIKFIGNYKGQIETEFEITAKTLGKSNITAISDMPYTGKPVKPELVIYDGDKLLVKDTDYTLAYPNPDEDYIGIGIKTVDVTYVGNYTGTARITYEVVQVESVEGLLIDEILPQEYTGDVIMPQLSISYNGMSLVKGTDYGVSFVSGSNKINVGTVDIKISFFGNFSIDPIYKSFEIIPKELDETNVAEILDVTYTGETQIPIISVNDGSFHLEKDVDYSYDISGMDFVNAGEKTITIQFKGNYTGTAEVKYEILPIALDSEDIFFTDEEGNPLVNDSNEPITRFVYTYTGNAIIPEFVLGSGDLLFGIEGADDFDILFDTDNKNVNAGMVGFTAKLKGNYRGFIHGTLVINPITVNEHENLLDISTIPDVEYTGEAIMPTVNVKYDGKNLTAGVDYRVSLSSGEDNVKPGDVELTISFIGNYAGTKTTEFTITPAKPKDISSSSLNIDKNNNYISKITAGTTISEFLNMIAEKNTVVVKKGTTVVSGNALIATGMTVNVMNGSQTVKTYTVVVSGDTNGDGKISITDMTMLKSHILKKSLLSGVYLKAADVAGAVGGGDAKVSITDFIKIKSHILKKDTIVGIAAK